MNNTCIYFDNAATSYPKPRSVIDAVERCIAHAGGNPGRSAHDLAVRAAEQIFGARTAVAELLSFDHPENIIFTENATYALNLSIKGLVRKGMYVLIGNTEHNAVYRPIEKLKSDGVIDYDIFDARNDPVASIKSIAKRKPDMIVLNHVSNVDGYRADIYSVGRYAKANGIIFILDASQSIGHIPISFKETCASALCAPAHKGLFGLQGCGFACFLEEIRPQTIIEGGSGAASSNTDMPPDLPERIEAGTLPTPSIASLYSGIEFVQNLGIPNIERHEKKLLTRASDMLTSLGAEVYASKNGTGVLSFNYKDLHPSFIGDGLNKAGICVRTGLHCAPLAHKLLNTLPNGTVRLSFSILNTEKELDCFYKALKELLFSV